MNDPKRTVRLLDELKSLGFTDQAFALIHHLPNETIERHRNYCLRVGSFQPDKTNQDVQRRLDVVLRAFRGGGFSAGKPAVFAALAQAACAEIPVSRVA